MTGEIDTLQFGMTGLVAETFRLYAARDDVPLNLAGVISSRPQSMTDRFRHRKQTLGQAGEQENFEVLEAHQDVPVLTLRQGLNFEAPLVFSSPQAEAAQKYERRLSIGRLLVSNASALRMEDDVALANAYFSSEQIDEMMVEDRRGRIIANGNCGSIILAAGLAPLRPIGVNSLFVTTLQGWSGKGLRAVPKGEEASITPIAGDEREKLATEPNKLLAPSRHHLEDLNIKAFPRRGPWVYGHYIEADATFSRETSPIEIEESWREFQAPDCFKGTDVDYLPQRYPIEVVPRSQILTKKPALNLDRPDPMRVRASVLRFDPEYPKRATVGFSGDNLFLGAAGSSVMNALYVMARHRQHLF
jgi:aspartate-semialdehyde dehydrogenase